MLHYIVSYKQDYISILKQNNHRVHVVIFKMSLGYDEFEIDEAKTLFGNFLI